VSAFVLGNTYSERSIDEPRQGPRKALSFAGGRDEPSNRHRGVGTVLPVERLVAADKEFVWAGNGFPGIRTCQRASRNAQPGYGAYEKKPLKKENRENKPTRHRTLCFKPLSSNNLQQTGFVTRDGAKPRFSVSSY
jgi:hypothetical protein